MKTIFALVLIFSFSAFADELRIEPYVKLQDALASDNFKAAQEVHNTLCEKELHHYKGKYKDCGKKFKDIEELRTSFKALSEVYLANGNRKELEGYLKASCPMAGAKWIQRPGSLRNPYYGKSMLECGEKI